MPDLDHWLAPQAWKRNGFAPCLSLGETGAFDDAHIFAPCVALEDGRYVMWYCGARGGVEERVFAMGLATSADGVEFVRKSRDSVSSLTDGRSILTPTLLRDERGAPLRENGLMRMWFSAADLTRPDAPHTLHEVTSPDGIVWNAVSDALLEDVYAPTIVRHEGTYHLWYTDPASDPWPFRYATSDDGRAWRTHPEPVLAIDQPWERQRLFYPFVMRVAGGWVMWYGSYHAKRHEPFTSLGMAVSDNGIEWRKSDVNPVFGPPSDPTGREWESNYTTSQTVLPCADGSLRIWYASRPAPPFTHKYFAIGTARWADPPEATT